MFGTPDVEASRAFYVDGLGFEVSDGIAGGLGWFLRCSTDHHNLLLMPAPVPCLNHYAVELDDLDAIGLTAMDVLGERAAELADAPVSVAGPGRHVLGANLFWYLLDPAGGMFELFADMDQIVDSAAWARDSFDDGWDPFGIAAWSPADPLPDFFLPADIADLAAAPTVSTTSWSRIGSATRSSPAPRRTVAPSASSRRAARARSASSSQARRSSDTWR